MSFEEYLLNKGYTKMVLNTKTMKLELPSKYTILSTMGNLDFRYVKEGYKTIIYGLYECNKPPVWIEPKPYSLLSKEELLEGLGHFGNDLLNKIYQKHTNDDIYESLNKEYELNKK